MRFITSLILIFTVCACGADTETAPPADTSSPAPSAGVVLQYHHVSNDTPRITSTTPDEFEAHMAHLDDAGFEIWPLPKLLDYVSDGRPTPPRVAAITFDDAYDNIHRNAFPVLKRYGWPFTIFVATEPVIERKAGFLTWAKLQEMADAGATIANHTHTHAHLLRLRDGVGRDEWLDRIANEITTAQEALDANLEADIPKMLAYTYGEYDPDVLAVVEELGFTGFGQQSGAVGPGLDMTLLPRFPFGGRYNDLEQFKTKIMTLPMPIETQIIDPMIEDDLTPTIELRFKRDDLRFNQLVCYTPGGGRAKLERDGLTFTATSEDPVPVARSRYNCTMPTNAGDRFYWYSQLWIRKRPDGTWYPEP